MTVSKLSNILAASERSFYHHAAINPLLMGLIFVAAIAMVFWLYRAQQRIASPRRVAVLTVLRVLLLLALLVLLLQPAVRWTHRQSSAGTLWLLLDGTGSMATTDPQATAVERLRWAEALEYLPADSRQVKLDQTVADLVCLRDELSRLRSVASYSRDGASIEAFTKALKSWQAWLDEAAAQLAKDGKSQPAANLFSANLGQTSKMAADGISASEAKKNLAEAISAIAWARLDGDLDLAVKILTPIADRADAEFVQAHGGEAGVKEAIAKVSKLSRAQLAELALTQKAARVSASLKDWLPAYRIRIVAITGKAPSATPVTDAGLAEAIHGAMSTNGQATNLAAGLRMIAEQAPPDEPNSVLILSDGKQNVDGDAAAPARQLANQGAHVYALAIGSSQPAIDAAVETVDAPDWVYKDDSVRASARIRADGLMGKEVAVEFWRGGLKLDTKKFTPGKGQEMQVIAFEDAHPEAGVHEYEIRVPEVAGEENRENNRQGFRVAVKSEQLKMLIVEDQPRWEYRHLVSYLSRDPRVKLQTILFQPTKINDVSGPAAVKASPINPKTEAQLLPSSKEEWLAFDVVVLGDVAASDLPAEAQTNLVAAVKDGGKALIVIAGQRNMPGSYVNAPLAGVLPVTFAADWSADALAEHLKSGFRPQVTAEGNASILSQFKLDAAENAAAWAAAPAWYWHSEQTQAKPAATVLWSIESTGDSNALEMNRRRALLATSAFGSGRVMYLASDQTWRLRQVNGENLQERFWGQVVRWGTGNDLPAGGQRARFGSDKPRYTEGEPVVVTTRLLKEDLTPLGGQSVEVIATTVPANATTAPASQPVETKIAGQAKLVEVPDSPGLYRATLTGLPAGQVNLSLRGGEVERLLADVIDEKQKSLSLSVQRQLTVEQRDINTDKAKLAEITKAGGGIMLDGPYGAVLAKYIPQPTMEQTSIEQFGFFGDPGSRYTKLTHWIFLGVFCALITVEWVIRKAGGLV